MQMQKPDMLGQRNPLQRFQMINYKRVSTKSDIKNYKLNRFGALIPIFVIVFSVVVVIALSIG